MDKQSGTLVKVPTLLSYPNVFKVTELPELKNEFVYLIEAYPLHGLSVVASRVQTENGIQINWRLGDWDGNEINFLGKDGNAHWANKFMENYSQKILQIMQLIKLFQAQFYFSVVDNDLCLVDIRISLNKFTGPGMVKDIFGKVVRVQREIAKPNVLTPDDWVKLSKNGKAYGQDIIIKPSAFKTIVRNKALMPMYAIAK